MRLLIFFFFLFSSKIFLHAQPTNCAPLRMKFHLYDKQAPVNAINAFLKYNCPISGLDKDYTNGKLSGYDQERYFKLYGIKLIDTNSHNLMLTYCTPNFINSTFQLYATNPGYPSERKDLFNPEIVDEMVVNYTKLRNSIDTVCLDSLVYSEDKPYCVVEGRKYRKVELLEQDSLILDKSAYEINEKIGFAAKAAHVRSVGTITCSCGNTDFYYRVYSAEKKGWKLFIDHTDNFNLEQCLCKIMYAEIINGNHYSIDPIKKAGTYYIEIKGGDFAITSKPFTVN